MANTIKIRNSGTASNAPSAASLEYGELAINYVDGKLYFKTGTSTVDFVKSNITLGTDTTGDYMSGVTAGTGISVTHTPSEGSSAAIAIDPTYQFFVPTGVINMWSTLTAPTGWVICNGSALNTYTYRVLHAVISNTYGGTAYSAGVTDQPSAITTFNIPNIQGKVPVGRDSADVSFDTLGEVGGAKTHTLGTTEMPAHTHTQDTHNHTQNSHNHTQNSHNHTQNTHTHTQNAHTHTQNSHTHGGSVGTGEFLYRDGTYSTGYNSWVGNTYLAITWNGATAGATATNQNATATNQGTIPTNVAATATNIATTPTNNGIIATNQNTGGGLAHNNLQPYIVLNYIIKV